MRKQVGGADLHNEYPGHKISRIFQNVMEMLLRKHVDKSTVE